VTAPFKLTHLQPGDRLRVVRGFTDFDGVAWAEGRTLEFVDYSYVPYDGGYTFTFREGVLRLAHLDAANDRVLRRPEEYFARVPPGA
jgi:hypothetical protein